MIGVFDSGLGGLTVVKEIFRQLPDFGVVYFGDTARSPYGNKSKETIERFTLQDADFLRKQGAEVLVMACNTASALATETLRNVADVPVFEVVTPAVDRALSVTSGKIGIIGTYGTVKSGIYERLIKEASVSAEVVALPCPLFVPLVEEGWYHHEVARRVAEEYLLPLKKANVDTLILGCTHYPFLRDTIKEVMGSDVRLIDPARATVSVIKAFMYAEPEVATLCKKTPHHFFASDRAERFREIADEWLGQEIALTEIPLE